jgi:hypothetical protein
MARLYKGAQLLPTLATFIPRQPLMAEDLNGNFTGIFNFLEDVQKQIERLENALIKMYKKQELKGSDLSFQSSLDLLYGKPEKSGRYGILKKKENKC